MKVLVSFTARLLAFAKPSLYNRISAMCIVSGTAIVIWRNRALRLSGSGARPMLNGFNVMNKPQLGLNGSSESSIRILGASSCFASESAITSYEMTASRLISSRLNSSKQAQDPFAARPLKNFDMEKKSICPWQLKTKQWRATFFPSSLIDSVFPVPAGPIGAPPYL